MSAYLVEDETINRVVEWLYWEVTKDPFFQGQLEEALGIDTTTYQWFMQLGQEMIALNIASVEVWYGEGEARRFRELNYHYTPAHGSAVQVLKSLQCWLYQCREGNVVKKPLYRFFRAVVEPHRQQTDGEGSRTVLPSSVSGALRTGVSARFARASPWPFRALKGRS